MTAMPSFNLKANKMSEDEYQQAQAEANKSRGFGPGYYQVVIKNVKYHARQELMWDEKGEPVYDTISNQQKTVEVITCKSDPTWVNVSFDLVGADGRNKKHYIQVPTQDIKFKTYGGKKILFPYNKLCEFLAALGETVTYQNYPEIIGKYFASEASLSELEGREVGIDVGFKGPYVKFVEQGKFRIVINGEEYTEGGEVKEFPDPDSAIAFGISDLNKNLQRWPEVLKFHPIVGGEKKEESTEESW